MDIQAWQVWLIAAVIAGGMEMALPSFVTLWFGIGGAAAALVSSLGFGLEAQLATFSLVSVSLFGASRTIFKSAFMRNAAPLKTGVAAMVGQEAVVTESLEEGQGGTVRINGELWAARSLAGTLGQGERVVVEQVEGLKLWVRRPAATLEVLSHRKEGR